MTGSLIEKASAKINLTLRVLGRRPDGYHELESLVAFADLADTLVFQPAPKTALDIAGPYAAACGPVADNLILKAVAALSERVGGLRAGYFKLQKSIPVAGGLGGGSADAAAALRLLALANDLATGDPRIMAAASAVGADVPVCLDPRPRIMRGIGERLSAPLVLPQFAVVLVNPGVPLPTRNVFKAYAGASAEAEMLSEVPRERDAFIAFLERHGNDLTQAAITRAPAVADVLRALATVPGTRLTRMSGSGPTCFALFNSPAEATAGALTLSAAHQNWWVHSGSVGA